MPYSLRGNQPGCDGWAVVNTATGHTVTCHPTKKKALAHLRALYKSIGDTTMQDLALNVQFPDAPGGMMQIGASGPDDDTLMALAHEKVGHTGQGLWHHKGMQLPAYIQHIANDLISERGMTESQAIATAVSRCKMWCAGGGGVQADTKAKACAAVAEWENLKTRAAAGTVPHLPALVTIPGVDILAAGTWQLSTGRQTFTRQDLQAAIEAAACPAVGSPLIKIGHLDPRFASAPDHDGEPAIGKVTNMRLNDVGTKITGDLAGMPGWLAGIAASAFPRRSVEGKYGFRCQIGHDHPFMISALALLGVTPPGVGVLSGLDDIAALYGVHAASSEQEWHTEPIEQQEGPVVAVTEEDVRRAYYAAGPPHTRWITELQMAPTQLIVADDADSKLYRVPFSIEAEAVSFGDPEEIDSYAGVAAARGTGTIIAWASAEESRAVTAGTLPPWLKPGGGKTTSDTGSTGTTGGYQVKTGVKGCFGHAVTDSSGKIVTGGCHPDQASAEKHLATLTKNAAAADQGNISAANAADLDAAARRYCAAQGWAMADGSYPIRPANMHGATDLSSAIRAVGRGGASHDTIRAHIIKRASAIGMPDRIPANWGQGGTTSAAAEDEDHGEDEQQHLEAAAGHGPYTGEHAHPHTANGDQGSDATHDHMHRHDGDGVHAHAHDPVSAAPPAAPAASNLEEVRVDFTTEQLAAIRAKLGKNDGEEVTPAEIAAAFTDAPTVTASAGMPAPNENLGVYMVEASVIDDWRKRAEAGDAAVHERRVADRDMVIAKAIEAGKIPQARKEHWQTAWNADPEGTRTQIERLASGLVPVGPAVGAAGMDPDLPGADFEEQMAYKKLFPEDVKAGRRG